MWLIKGVDCDIYRVLNELDKVALFPKNEQKVVFSAISSDLQKDLYKVDLFAIVNALVDGNMTALFELFKYANLDAIEPVVLANRTFSSLKNILLASQNPGLTAEDCGMTQGQYRFIKYNYRNINTDAVKAKLKFLARFDFALKTSKLDMAKHDMLAYLINNMAYKIIK
jgi:DNA polymerase III delta subunit